MKKKVRVDGEEPTGATVDDREGRATGLFAGTPAPRTRSPLPSSIPSTPPPNDGSADHSRIER